MEYADVSLREYMAGVRQKFLYLVVDVADICEEQFLSREAPA